MRLLVQRVKSAQVTVDDQIVGAIGPGALVFLGVTHTDLPTHSTYLASKLLNLRMFHDAQEKMNLSLLDTRGSILIVSQFTLYADCSEGRRPSFTPAAPPPLALSLYNHFIAEVQKSSLTTATGTFGAYMQVSLQNDGPVTFIIDSKP